MKNHPPPAPSFVLMLYTDFFPPDTQELWHFSVWACEEKYMICTVIWTNCTGCSHPEKPEQGKSVPGLKKSIKKKFKKPFRRAQYGQESRQELKEHHLEPRVWMAAVSEEAACRQSNCSLLWQWNDCWVRAHPAGFSPYPYSTAINFCRL